MGLLSSDDEEHVMKDQQHFDDQATKYANYTKYGATTFLFAFLTTCQVSQQVHVLYEIGTCWHQVHFVPFLRGPIRALLPNLSHLCDHSLDQCPIVDVSTDPR